MNQHAPSVRRPATYQDLLDAPEGMVAELMEGALHLHPRPTLAHAVAGSSLTGTLNMSFQQGRGGPGGWWILVEPELHLGPDVLVPDLAGWRRERMPDRPREAWTGLAPDWVCEILSPGTRRIDLIDKRRLYAEAAVPFLWFVDPESQTLEAFALRGGEWTLAAALKEDENVRVPPFDAISFPLSVLWPD